MADMPTESNLDAMSANEFHLHTPFYQYLSKFLYKAIGLDYNVFTDKQDS